MGLANGDLVLQSLENSGDWPDTAHKKVVKSTPAKFNAVGNEVRLFED